MKRSVFLLGLVLVACEQRVPMKRVPGLGKADAIWLNGSLCAHTAEGLACARSNPQAPADALRVVTGLGKVTDVAVTDATACALDERGVACFEPGKAESKRLALEAPTQVIAGRVGPCILHAKGVSCLTGGGEPKLVADLAHPKRLLFDEREHMLCGVEADATRCWSLSLDGAVSDPVMLAGTKEPRHVFMNTAGANALVLDGDQLLYGKIPADRAAKVQLSPLATLGPVRDAIFWYSGSLLLLDARGVERFTLVDSGHEEVPCKSKSPPSGIAAAGFGEHITIEGEHARRHGLENNKSYDREITGTGRPVRIVSDVWWTCILDDAGAVACTPAGQP